MSHHLQQTSPAELDKARMHPALPKPQMLVSAPDKRWPCSGQLKVVAGAHQLHLSCRDLQQMVAS